MLPRTDPQWETALKKGNKIRLQIADEKRKLRSGGRLYAAGLLHDPPDHVGRMKLADFLRAIPQFQDKTMVRFLVKTDTPRGAAFLPIRELTERQRQGLAQALAARRNGKP